ncbi:MAG: insulinase family protein, partial [Bacteroidales bacterium]|nr:insulinase family protein [Bacteroidales bacterium]
MKTSQPQERLDVRTFQLENGLKVVMAEEHSAHKVFGAVIVHAGSKNEDTAYTGVAHYFEHMMF